MTTLVEKGNMKVFIDAHVECVTLIVAKKALNHKDQGFWLNGICVFCVRLDEMFRRHFYFMESGILGETKGGRTGVRRESYCISAYKLHDGKPLCGKNS